MEKDYLFPQEFLWGSATSAWQIEGGVIQNEYFDLHRRGLIAGGGDPAEAAGFWEYYPQDIALLQQMHQRTFRMSLEWARIEPEEGRFDEAVIQHYRKILLTLRQVGIIPIVDLLHHSSPFWLYRYGGWTNPKSVRYLCRFAERTVSQLGDLVSTWLTINEPTVWAAEAYLEGVLPPYKRSLRLFLKSLRVFSHAHVALYNLVNEVYARQSWVKPSIGFAHATQGIDPLNPHSLPDRTSARLVHYILEDHFINQVMKKKPTLDLLGINYYTCLCVKFPYQIHLRTDLPQSIEGWPIDPPGFYRVLKYLWDRYHLPLWVTENGVGEEDDELRPRFILDHLYQMHCAISTGVDVRAYHHWSALDTLEYHKGYGIKYGLIKVDFSTKEKTRTIRKSGRMYSEIAASNGITQEIVKRYVPDWDPDSFPNGYSRRYNRSETGGLF